jgi:hypothetical protein
VEGLRITTKNLSHDSRSPGRDINPGPPEYEAGVLLTLKQRSVVIIKDNGLISTRYIKRNANAWESVGLSYIALLFRCENKTQRDVR